MFALVAVHHHTALCLKFPCALVDIEHHDVEPQVAGGFLGRKTCAERVVEKDEQSRFVVAKMFVFVAVGLYFGRFGQREVKRTEVVNVQESLHKY